MKEMIQRVKGTREFYPEDMAFRSWLNRQIKQVSESFGYQEYDGPFLEKIDLYAAKSGEELVKEQAFVFTDRSGGLVTLRPELTPSLARMVAQKQNELVYPLRYWSFGPFWRYEQPQKGRSREFFQWNIDLLGPEKSVADLELLLVCISFFRQIGLTSDKAKIFINNRKLMEEQLEKVGFSDKMKAIAFKLIDRQDKMSPSAWHDFALDQGLSEENVSQLENLLGNYDLWKESEDLRLLFESLKALGYDDYIVYDPHIIRGILYYTGNVFEAKDTAKDGRAILGGGRYENLVSDVGGKPLAGVGFAMGDVMIKVILEKYGLLPNLNPQPAATVVTVFSPELFEKSNEIAIQLRESGVNAICYPEPAKIDKQLKYANRIGAKVAIVIGPDEAEKNQVAIKSLTNHNQIIVDKADLVKNVQALIK